MFKIIAVLVLSMVAVPAIAAENCKFPEPSVYAAPLAKLFIGYLQNRFPTIQFNPEISKITSANGDNGRDMVVLQTADGTVLNVTGSFQIVPTDVIDAEGNVTGCNLWLFTENAGSPYISAVINAKSGHNILPVRNVAIGPADARSFSLEIHYPYP